MHKTNRKICLPVGQRPKKKARLPPTEAILQMEKLDEADRAAGTLQCNAIHRSLTTSAAPLDDVLDPAPLAEDLGQHNFEENQNENHFLDQFLPAPVAEVLPQEPPQNLEELITSDRYKKKRLKEEQAWSRHIQKIFITFMRWAHITSEGGNESVWDTDHFDHRTCFCSDKDKTSRQVDLVDICSE